MLKIRQSLLRPKFAVLEPKRLQTDMSREWKEARPYEEIPRVTVWHLVRSSLPGGKNYKMDLAELMIAMKKDFGNVFLIPAIMGRAAVLITHNANDFERIFRNEGPWPERPGQEALQYHREKHRSDFFQGHEGLISTQGKSWGKFRSAVNPILMQPKNVRLQFKKMSQVNKLFIECIKNIRDPKTLEVPADFEDYINRWTFESVSVIALDKQLGLLTNTKPNPEAALLFKSLNDFFEYSTDIELKPSPWRWIATPMFKKLMDTLDIIQKVTSGYVQEAIERIDEEHKRGITRPESEQSVLEKLLKVDKKIATVMAMDMLMAGVDTTTSAFAGILLCLAKHPEKQAKLRDEVFRILPNKGSEFTEDSMKHMPYLRACIKESLRFYPLTWGNARLIKNDTVISGYRVPKDTFVSISTVSCLKNAEYFQHPEEFLPERWLRSEKSSDEAGKCPANDLKVTNPFVYLPFGFGPRMCIGKRIVEMELELGLARIIRNFHVEFNYPMAHAFRAMIISTPNIPLRFKFIDVKD